MEKEYRAGTTVIFVDPLGVRRQALVTQWHCSDNREEWLRLQQETCCNLVWVTNDEKRRDTYGQQLIRESSVVHKSSQPAHGNYWCWPDE